MAKGTRPRIGINGVMVGGDSPRVRLPLRYACAVLEAGGIPFVLAPVGERAEIEQMLDSIDGLLLSGGDDFDTARLGLGPTHAKAVPVPAEKQDWDFELARMALTSGMPVLGVCYGMQLLGLCEGGHLFQHLPDDRPGCQEHRGGTRHAVHIVPGTQLARLLATSEAGVVSRHHQALASVVSPWRVSARDEEGLIEAIERNGHPFAIGVQWHPELCEQECVRMRLFRGLIEAASHAELRTTAPALS